MSQRFTDRALKVMALANREAQLFNHEYVCTEHVLLGLVKEGSGVGATVLRNLEVDPRKVRLEVEKLVKSGPDLVSMGKLPQTPACKKVLELANDEARLLGHNYVGTEHLLLGLIRGGDGVAAKVLLGLNLTLERVREALVKHLGASSDRSEEETRADPKPGQKSILIRVTLPPDFNAEQELCLRALFSSVPSIFLLAFPGSSVEIGPQH